jgi:hypothetical protein
VEKVVGEYGKLEKAYEVDTMERKPYGALPRMVRGIGMPT